VSEDLVDRLEPLWLSGLATLSQIAITL